MSNPEELSLTSYAAVMAGLGAGLPLRRALELADVPETAWEPGAEHWQRELDESAATDLSEVVAFDAALVQQQRRFEPVTEPITSDVAAWACFRRHFVTATDAAAFLAERELSFGAYARLEADWLHRTAADEALATALREAMSGPLGPCPALTRTPSPLLAESPLPAPSTEPLPAVVDSPSPSLATVVVAPPVAAAPLPLGAPVFASPVASTNETLGPWSVKPSVAVPFGGGVAQTPAPNPPTAPVAARPAAPAGGTMLSLAIPESLPLPFSAAKASGPPRFEARTILAPQADESETTAVPVPRKGPVMPFLGGAAAAPPPPRPLAPAPPSGESTLLSAPVLPHEPTLPFAPQSLRAPTPPGPPPPAPEGLPIERFAVILAELESGSVPAEVLARHRLSTLAWSGLEVVWRRRLAALPEEAERVASLVRAVKERLAKR